MLQSISRNVVDRKQYIDKERFVCLFKEKGDLNMFNSCGGGQKFIERKKLIIQVNKMKRLKSNSPRRTVKVKFTMRHKFTVFFFQIFMWTIFKILIEFVTIFILSYVLVLWPQGMWDLSSLTRDQTLTPCIGRGGLNYWMAREVPTQSFFKRKI